MDNQIYNHRIFRYISWGTLKGECVSFGLSRRNHRGHVIARYDEKTGKFQRTKEWVLDTDGVPHP